MSRSLPAGESGNCSAAKDTPVAANRQATAPAARPARVNPLRQACVSILIECDERRGSSRRVMAACDGSSWATVSAPRQPCLSHSPCCRVRGSA